MFAELKNQAVLDEVLQDIADRNAQDVLLHIPERFGSLTADNIKTVVNDEVWFLQYQVFYVQHGPFLIPFFVC